MKKLITIFAILGVVSLAFGAKKVKEAANRLFSFYLIDATGQHAAPLQQYGSLSATGGTVYVYRDSNGQVFLFDHELRYANGIFDQAFNYTPSLFDREDRKPFDLMVSGHVIHVDPEKLAKEQAEQAKNAVNNQKPTPSPNPSAVPPVKK